MKIFRDRERPETAGSGGAPGNLETGGGRRNRSAKVESGRREPRMGDESRRREAEAPREIWKPAAGGETGRQRLKMNGGNRIEKKGKKTVWTT